MRVLLNKLNRKILKNQLTVDEARSILLQARSTDGRKHERMKQLARTLDCSVRSVYRWGLE